MFKSERITQALWPEVAGVGLYLGASLMAANMDAQREEGAFPVAQTFVTYGSMAGGAAMVGFNRGHDLGKGLMIGSGVGLLATAIKAIYDEARKVEGRARLSDCAAFILPRRVGAVGRPAGGSTARLSLSSGVNFARMGAKPSLSARTPSPRLPAGVQYNDFDRDVLPTVEWARGM